MNDDNVSIIEITADYLYLIILGDKVKIDNLINIINNNNNNLNKTIYISVKIDTPVAHKCDEYFNILNLNKENNKYKHIVLDDSIEMSQCCTYAEGYSNQLYMIMCIVEEDMKYILGYPKFELGDEEDPELIIVNWFKKNTNTIPNGIKKNIKLITVVGPQTNILVVATKIKK